MKKGSGDKSNDAYNYGNGLKKINAYFAADEYDQIVEIAKRNGITISRLIRLGVNREINDYLSHIQIIDCDKLIKSINDLDQDLKKIKQGLTLQALDISRESYKRGRIDMTAFKKADELFQKVDYTIAPFDRNELDERIKNITTAIRELNEIKFELFKTRTD